MNIRDEMLHNATHCSLCDVEIDGNDKSKSTNWHIISEIEIREMGKK